MSTPSQVAGAVASRTADPFAPAGVDFQPVSPRLATARLLGIGIGNAMAFLGFAIPAVLWSPWMWIGAALVLVTGVWEMALVPRQVRAMGYALAEDHLLWRKGVMFRSLSVIPYGRMQMVDTSQGPIAARLGIAEVKLRTASASTDATINGLPAEEAEHLRQILAERGEDRMAGL
ncbi:MAG: PH domain-containing protein [Actinomyces sp.]|uniref:PH domain-containing protein n=1 Tax=Actinomyces sp. TaxID=29317 RepID=UPI0026DCB6A3|nr:PH domain-containing protein [Actinomyces sp.]MDO4244275.1 PH domain-containing protein [Actinomyces sp.]